MFIAKSCAEVLISQIEINYMDINNFLLRKKFLLVQFMPGQTYLQFNLEKI